MKKIEVELLEIGDEALRHWVSVSLGACNGNLNEGLEFIIRAHMHRMALNTD